MEQLKNEANNLIKKIPDESKRSIFSTTESESQQVWKTIHLHI